MRRKRGRELRLSSGGKTCVFFFFFSTGEGQIRGEHVRYIILFAGALRGGRNHWQLTDAYCNLNSPVLVLLGLLGLLGGLRPMSGMCWTSPGIAGEPSARHLGARCQGMDGMDGMEQARRFAHQGQKSSDSTTLRPPGSPCPCTSTLSGSVRGFVGQETPGTSEESPQSATSASWKVPDLLSRDKSLPTTDRKPPLQGAVPSMWALSPPNFPSLPMLACWGLWPLPSAVEIMYSTCDRYLAASGKKEAATRRTAPAATHALTGWLSFTHFMDPEPLCSRPAAY
jgi:hypothetical protein